MSSGVLHSLGICQGEVLLSHWGKFIFMLVTILHTDFKNDITLKSQKQTIRIVLSLPSLQHLLTTFVIDVVNFTFPIVVRPYFKVLFIFILLLIIKDNNSGYKASVRFVVHVFFPNLWAFSLYPYFLVSFGI